MSYVDTSLINSGTVDEAAIFSLKGDKVLASSTGFMVSFTERAEILEIFSDKGTGPNVIRARNNGFSVAGTSYYAVRANARSLYGQSTCAAELLDSSHRDQKDDEGVVIIKTTQAIIIAHYSAGSGLHQAARCIEQLGDHLIDAGF
ncbi:hypothetical protein VE03_06934 [Pseudogymnoascus sp. 23342-1-I1]|nr:hypothetical protein VE03_06934 [Pseudogymnoascus sp. 23342-1-I1]